MLSELSVFVRGSCRFEAEGDFSERFLNLCARADMGLWDIVREEHGISARVIAARYRRLLPYARRCGVRLRVVRRFGLPFLLTPYRHRPGMPLGAALFCGTLWMLSLFIWSVELPATLTPDTTESLAAALEEMSVTPGTLRSHIDAQGMAVELQVRVPELSWAGISTYGSRLSIDAKELDPVVQPPEGTPCNLVAARDGVVVAIEPLRGSIEVQPGQSVIMGDLLVSGVVEHLDGSVQITDASAVVWAHTTRTLKCTMPYEQLVSRRTGRLITRHRVRLLGIEIPLLFSIDTEGSYEREYSDWQLTVGSLELPFEVHTEKCYELEQCPVTYTPEQAEALALEELERRVSSLGSIEIVDREVKVTRGDSGVTVELLLTVKENIAASSAIGIQ